MQITLIQLVLMVSTWFRKALFVIISSSEITTHEMLCNKNKYQCFLDISVCVSNGPILMVYC